jgi:hypothetical protein
MTPVPGVWFVGKRQERGNRKQEKGNRNRKQETGNERGSSLALGPSKLNQRQ